VDNDSSAASSAASSASRLVGGKRNNYQCRDHWRNIDSSLSKDKWNAVEDESLLKLVEEHGKSSWTLLASKLVGGKRNTTQCRNRWVSLCNKSLKASKGSSSSSFSSTTNAARKPPEMHEANSSNNNDDDDDERTREADSSLSSSTKKAAHNFVTNLEEYSSDDDGESEGESAFALALALAAPPQQQQQQGVRREKRKRDYESASLVTGSYLGKGSDEGPSFFEGEDDPASLECDIFGDGILVMASAFPFRQQRL
jgi:hypothetical protein